MEKVSIILLSTANLILYGLGPLTITYFLGSFLENEVLSTVLLIFWGGLTAFLLISMKLLISGSFPAACIFITLIFLSAGVQVSDEVLTAYSNNMVTLNIPSVLDNFIVPLISAWFYFFSDAADYFRKKEIKNE